MKPNILYLHSHDAGRCIEPYGFPVATPNLMRFAREGVLFRRAFSCSPTCGPSRVGLLTGQYPHECGVYGLPGRQGWIIDDYDKHLVHLLNDRGYETALAGVQHETDVDHLERLGYTRMLNTRDNPAEFYPETIDHVERYLAEKARGDAKMPFFLSVGIDEPHRNNIARPEMGIGTEAERFSKTRYYDPERLDSRYTAPLPHLPDDPTIRADVESLWEGVRLMDAYMGRVLYALEQHGLSDSTLVVVTTDHGVEFPGGKMTLSDWGIGVMLLMRGPKGFQGGRVIEPMVTHLDIAPTILGILGENPRPWHRGRSLLPLMTCRTERLHDVVFAEQTYHGALEPLRCARTDRYKLVRRHFPTGPRIRQAGPSTRVMATAGFYDRDLPAQSFYDLHLDPQEACDRATDSAYAEQLREHEVMLDDWMSDTGDCFPSGDFPEPLGTR